MVGGRSSKLINGGIIAGVIVVILLGSMLWIGRAKGSTQITQEELVGRTQAMFDAVATGNQAPWNENFAEDAMYFDEKGRSMDKTALLADVTPLPTGYSGAIKVVNPHSRMKGDTAILSYDTNETESIFGQNVTARYHETDTWMYRDGKWQIVAGQVLRYYEDPKAGSVDPARLQDYVGTYRLAPDVLMTVTSEEGKLYAQRGSGQRTLLMPESPDVFFRTGVEGRRLFRRNAQGKVDALVDRRNNEDVVWTRV